MYYNGCFFYVEPFAGALGNKGFLCVKVVCVCVCVGGNPESKGISRGPSLSSLVDGQRRGQ